jgi:hypothetical protein
MAPPKGTQNKRWRTALESTLAMIQQHLLKPDITDETPEDEKYMEPGDYFKAKYPTPKAVDDFYVRLTEWLCHTVNADMNACNKVRTT